MYQVMISTAEQKEVLTPVMELEDAVYWVKRLVALGYEADMVCAETMTPPSFNFGPKVPMVTVVS